MLVHRSRSVVIPIVLALAFAVLALVGWSVTGRTWPLLVALVVLLGAVAWAELRTSAWRHVAQLPGHAPAPASAPARTIGIPPQPTAGGWGVLTTSEGLDAADVEPLGQDDYAELLVVDRIAATRFQPAGAYWTCKTCDQCAVVLSVAHPIWDGPFHGAGSGRCDVRDVFVCPHCDQVSRRLEKQLGLWPALVHLLIPTMTEILTHGTATGRPIRLPWLNTLPIRLREELYDRPAFHNLMVRVERASPPLPPAPSRQPHVYVVYDQDEPRHEPSAARPEQPCEVCEQPYQAPLHVHAFEEGTAGAAGPAACRRCGLASWAPIHGDAAAGGGWSA